MTPPSLAAFRLGVETRRLRVLQQTLWALSPTAAANLDPCVREIDRQLMALSNNLNEYQYSRFDHLRKRLIDRHEAAARTKGAILAEIIDQYEDPVDAFLRLQELCPERCRFFIAKQEEDWQELGDLSHLAVEPHHHLCARWEIGFGLAGCLEISGPLPADAGLSLAAAGIEMLAAEDRRVVTDILSRPFTNYEWYEDLVDYFAITPISEGSLKPYWDPKARKLWVKGRPVGIWRDQQDGNQLTVMNRLQEQEWAEAIEHFMDEWQAREAVKALNRKLKNVIAFSASRSSISWRLA